MKIYHICLLTNYHENMEELTPLTQVISFLYFFLVSIYFKYNILN